MNVQYVSDTSGRTTAVIIPITDWNTIRSRHPDIDTQALPKWQTDIIDERLQLLHNLDSIIPLDEFTGELKEGLNDEF